MPPRPWSPKLASDIPAVPSTRPPVPLPAREPGHAATDGLARLNAVPAPVAEAELRTCCGSRRWARRMAAHRPYPDLAALLAAADEAVRDLPRRDLDEAFAAERPQPLPAHDGAAAQTALGAGQGEYERRFGRAFVVCVDAVPPAEQVNHVLASLRARLDGDADQERAIAAEELRALARGRLARLVQRPAHRPR